MPKPNKPGQTSSDAAAAAGPAWSPAPGVALDRYDVAILDALHGLDGRLKDPESGEKDQQPDYVLKQNPELRSIKPDLSVLVGLCTHLGCSPEMVAEIRPEPYDPQWKGGYFCPCHKSRFDMSGRVFKDVPAPINLKVPAHHYQDDNTIIIGVDPQGAA